MEYLITPAADLGRFYKSADSARAGEQEKEKKITVKRVSPDYVFDPAGELPTTKQLTAGKLPVTVSEETGRLFYAAFNGKMQKKGFDAILRIDASLFSAKLYINGQFVTSIEHSLICREIRVGTFLNTKNTLFLEILDNPSTDADVVRGMTLYYVPQSNISDIFLRNRMHEDGVELFADVTVTAGDVEMALGGKLAMHVLDDAGQVVAESETVVMPFHKHYWAVVRASVTLALPRPWSLDDPYRYTVLFELTRSDKKVVDVRRLEYGIRELRLTRFSQKKETGPSLMLNGLPLKIKGAVVREQTPSRVKKLKTAGFNAVRIVNPINPAFVEACEKNGILAMCEASFTVRPNPRQRGRKRIAMPDPLDRPVSLVGEMVSRYKNKASIVCWSLGSRGPFGYGVLRELIRSIDDTRAINCEGDLRFVASDFYTAADCGEEALFLLLARKTISDGKMFGVRVPYSRYIHRPFLLSEAAPDIEPLRKKFEIMENHSRLLGMFIDCGDVEDYRQFSVVFEGGNEETDSSVKEEVEQTTLEEQSGAKTDE